MVTATRYSVPRTKAAKAILTGAAIGGPLVRERRTGSRATRIGNDGVAGRLMVIEGLEEVVEPTREAVLSQLGAILQAPFSSFWWASPRVAFPAAQWPAEVSW